MVNTTMRMNKTLDGRYGNRGDNPNAITQGAIVVTKMKTQDRVGNNPLSLKPPPRSTDGTTYGGRRKWRQGMGNGRKPPAGGIPGNIPHRTVSRIHRQCRNDHHESEYSVRTTGARNNSPPVSDGWKKKSPGPQRILQALYVDRGGPGDVHEEVHL